MSTVSLLALPTESEAALAQETTRILARQKKSGSMRLRLLDDAKHSTIQLPAPAVKMLIRILDEMSLGNAVTLTPVHPELTTQQAANLLNISRPSLVQLLDEGKISYRKIGTHRRVRHDSLIAFKRKADADRRTVLAKLAAYDQELGI